MPHKSRNWKVTSMRLRLLIQQLQLLHAALTSESVVEYESLLSEASATFKSIPATIPIGNGSGSTTLGTTREQLTDSGMLRVKPGDRGISAHANSD